MMKSCFDRFFTDTPVMKSASYDASAALYDAAFQDMTVRELEWDFVTGELRQLARKLGRLPRVLEIGCGNGQLLRQLLDGGFLDSGVGLDVSEKMIALANVRHREVKSLSFQQVEGVGLDCGEKSFDVVLSFLSFRYLDWEGIADEIERVGDHFLMVDMAKTELQEDERHLYKETKARTEKLHANRPDFVKALRKLVGHPAWKEMLEKHPRIEAGKYETFLSSRFQGGEWQRLYVCYDHSVFTYSVVL